ncbi:MAG: tetratricopeptide repeat protein [Acidobacteriia bacterium]|nr:tetratricopeptide repeat protein [Terriglobia bacterium]
MRGRIRAREYLRAAGVAAAALVVLLVCAGPSRGQGEPKHGHAAWDSVSRGQFLVFPFENHGAGERLDWLGEGLEELVIRSLAVSAQRVYSREERVAELERYGLPATAKLSRASMLRLAEELDADYIVFGEFSLKGKELAVEGRILRVSPPALLPAVRESGAPEALVEIENRMVWKLLRAADPSFPRTLAEFMRLQKPLRVEAFEHYIRGLYAGESDLRVRELREAARLDPNWPDAAFALGQSLVQRRDCAAALPLLERIPQGHASHEQAIFYTGVCRLWMDQADLAEQSFLSLQALLKKGAEEGGDVPELLGNLGVARARGAKSAAAREDFKQAAEMDPGDDDYPFNLGLLALRGEDYAGATAEFREALKREPEDDDARALLVLALERGGAKEEAEKERAAAAGPLPVIVAGSLARLERIKTELDTSALQTAVDSAEDPAPAAAAAGSASAGGHVRAGRQQLAAGRLAEAESEFRAALAVNAGDAPAHRFLGEVKLRQGRRDEAAAEFLASLELRDSAVVRTMLARIYVDGGKPELARQQLEKALKLAPNYAEAKQLLHRLDAAKTGAVR